LGKNRIGILFVLLTAFQTLHSIEEIITRLYDRFPIVTGKLHEVVSFFPQLTMSSTTFVALNILAVASLIFISVFIFKGKRWAYQIGRVFAIIEIFNGLAHVSAAAYTGEYFPGAVSGIGLVVIGTLLIFTFRTDFSTPSVETYRNNP